MTPSVVIQAENYNTGGEHYGYHKNPLEGGMQQETQNGITYLKGMKSGRVGALFNQRQRGWTLWYYLQNVSEAFGG